jgi:uncharacterized protein with FMN-binding domain
MFRRIIILITGTIAGVVAVVSYHPPQLGAVSAVGNAAPITSTPSGTATAQPSTPAKTGASSGTSTVAGNTAQTQWGPVQVEITLTAGTITSVRALQFPNGDRRSQSISQQAIPYLIQQTLTTKSANVVGVSGASYTSDGWRRSLASARLKAGI